MLRRLFSLIPLSLLLLPATVNAKDLGGRIGVGFDNSLSELPAFSVRYGVPTGSRVINLQVEGDLGMSVAEDNTLLLFGGRALYGLVVEDNLNIYGVGGVALLSGGESTVMSIQPGLALDFFLFGLENLGFTTTWGLDMVMGDENSSIRSRADLGAGMHYWF